MDLYSQDYAGIQEGNMRTKAVMDRNQAVKEHNDNIANQIAELKKQTKGAERTSEFQETTQQFWAGGQLPNKISALQDHLSKGGTLFSNPTSQAQDKAKQALSDSAQAPPDDTEPPKLTDTGDGIFESGEGFLEEGSSLSSKIGATALKGLGGATALATGGFDIYKDIESIKNGHGIAGDNWAEKASNVLQIGGAISDLGGTVFPPLAVLGGITDLTAGVFGEIGAAMDDDAKEKSEDQLQQQQTEQVQAQQVQAPVVTGRVS